VTSSPGARTPAAYRLGSAVGMGESRPAGSIHEDLPGDPARHPLALVAARCCVCGDRGAEPVAVAEDFDYRTSPDSFLTLRCNGCGSVYLSPAPAAQERERIYSSDYAAATGRPVGLSRRLHLRRITRDVAERCNDLRPGARILAVGYGSGLHLQLLEALAGNGWQLDAVGPTSSAAAVRMVHGPESEIHPRELEDLEPAPEAYDLAVLPHTLEYVADPSSTLAALSRLLRPGGRAVVVVNNLASPSFRWFGGRHWGGYDLPRQRRLFTAEALRLLAQQSRLDLTSLSTVASGGTWVRSVRRLLQDWAAPAWLARRFGDDSLLTALSFGLVEGVCQRAGNGALMVAVLQRPEVSE
jgi:SAM-dependent methyltransferase